MEEEGRKVLVLVLVMVMVMGEDGGSWGVGKGRRKIGRMDYIL